MSVFLHFVCAWIVCTGFSVCAGLAFLRKIEEKKEKREMEALKQPATPTPPTPPTAGSCAIKPKIDRSAIFQRAAIRAINYCKEKNIPFEETEGIVRIISEAEDRAYRTKPEVYPRTHTEQLREKAEELACAVYDKPTSDNYLETATTDRCLTWEANNPFNLREVRLYGKVIGFIPESGLEAAANRAEEAYRLYGNRGINRMNELTQIVSIHGVIASNLDEATKKYVEKGKSDYLSGLVTSYVSAKEMAEQCASVLAKL